MPLPHLVEIRPSSKRRFKVILEPIRFGYKGQTGPAFADLLMTGRGRVLAAQDSPGIAMVHNGGPKLPEATTPRWEANCLSIGILCRNPRGLPPHRLRG